MEELTVSLTNETRQKDSIIGDLKSSITEKDLEIAKTIREVDEGNSKLRQSLIEEQSRAKELTMEIDGLRQSLESIEKQKVCEKEETSQKVAILEQEL